MLNINNNVGLVDIQGLDVKEVLKYASLILGEEEAEEEAKEEAMNDLLLDPVADQLH